MTLNTISLTDAAKDMLSASVGEISWVHVLDNISKAMNARGVNLLPIRSQYETNIENTRDIDEMRDYYFKNEIYRYCIRQRAIPIMESRGVAVDFDYTDETERRKDPYYQEFLRPFNLLWSAYIGYKVDGDLLSLMVHRGVDQAPFNIEEQQALLSVSKHLEITTYIARRLGHARLDGLRSAFELANMACLFFDVDGRIESMNHTAELVLARSGIQIRQGWIVSPHARGGNDVHKAAFSLSGLSRTKLAPLGAIRALIRPGMRSLAIRLIPLSKQLRIPFGKISTVGIIIDPDAEPHELSELARVLFQLTPTEAKITSALFAGQNLPDIAEALAISHNTARTHLKHIFDKTATNSQGALLAVLSRL